MLAAQVSRVTVLRFSLLSLTCVSLLAGCADKRITLTYTPPAVAAPPTRQAQPLTIYAFNDRRGDEGDNDPMRVGGIYGGYGNRLSKVMADVSLMQTLVNALAEAFKARGVPVTVVPTPLAPDAARSPDLALSGDLKNFSTEARFTNSAHISGIVRLYAPDGAVLVEKELSERLRSDEGGGGGVFTDVKDLQRIMNETLAKFVERVVTDPDLTARLTSQ